MRKRASAGANIQAVFFDLDDTLVLTSDADLQALGAVARLAASLCPQVNGRQLTHSWTTRFTNSPWDPTGTCPVESWRARLWQYSLAEQGVPDAAALGARLQACFSQHRLGCFRLQPGVRRLLATLQRAEITPGIITNGHAEVQRAKLAAIEAKALFPIILVGHEEISAGRAEKPDPRIFLAACQQARCSPQEALFIGDSLQNDVKGALDAGFRAAVWVNRHGRRLPEGAPQPTHTVATVTEVSLVLQSLGALPGRPSASCARPRSEFAAAATARRRSADNELPLQ